MCSGLRLLPRSSDAIETLRKGNARGARAGITLRAHSEDEQVAPQMRRRRRVMGILELFVVAFLIGVPAILIADGAVG
jgi:hypothetical protein